MKALTTLFKTSPEIMQEYVASLARHLSHWEMDPVEWTGKTPSQRAVLYARTSALLSGVPSDELPKADVWKMDRQTHSHQVIEFFENDVVLAEVCMYGTRKIVPPEILNASICRDRMTIRWRTSNDISVESDIPLGKHTQNLVQFWTKTATSMAPHVATLPKDERRAYAWAMHHAFLCIKPFSAGNSRTSRLCLQMCRTSVGLPPIAYRPKESHKVRMHLEMFRTAIFTPLMYQRGTM